MGCYQNDFDGLKAWMADHPYAEVTVNRETDVRPIPQMLVITLKADFGSDIYTQIKYCRSEYMVDDLEQMLQDLAAMAR